MSAAERPFDPALAARVRADTLEPRQRRATPRLKTSADFRLQHMVKHDHLSEFYSRAEHLHAGLLEGDPHVLHYTPHPFALRIGKRVHTPDCYIVSEAGPRRVVDIRARGELPAGLRPPIEAFLESHRLRFEVVSSESIYEREVEAENWIDIVRALRRGRDFTTDQAEYRLLGRLAGAGSLQLGDVIDRGDRERTYLDELGLLRLLHRGLLQAELAERPLNYDTAVWPCL